MPKPDEDLLNWSPETVAETIPGTSQQVHFRYPVFEVWHALVTEHAEHVGRLPPASLIAKTLIACVTDEDGKQLFTEKTVGRIMAANPSRVTWLYRRILETVLKNDNEQVQEVEKNSAAGQD